MVYLFAIPLLLGVLPQLAALTNPKLAVGSSWQKTIHAFAVATLTVGSLLQGIVEIYGTNNRCIAYYFVVGIGLLAVSLMMWLVQFMHMRSMAQVRSEKFVCQPIIKCTTHAASRSRTKASLVVMAIFFVSHSGFVPPNKTSET